MLSPNELNLLQSHVTVENMAKLVAEVERLQQLIRDYSASVESKLLGIERDTDRLEKENARLVIAKETLGIERDACVALITKMASMLGVSAGLAVGNRVVVDLPSGQVSWVYAQGEAHLFEDLPQYVGMIEDLSVEAKYARVMSPGL